MPRSIKVAKKFMKRSECDFEQFTCFPSVLVYNKMGKNKPLVDRCSYVPDTTPSTMCNIVLTKIIKTPSQSLISFPKLVYCYQSVKKFLQEQLMRPESLHTQLEYT